MNSRFTATSTPIAIVGMGCMFPKAPDLVRYWRLLRRGEDSITETPATHWMAGDYFDADPKRPDFTYCARGGFLSPVNFDPSEFGIPPTILEATDTSQLLGLMVAKAALEDAGYGEGREFNRERVSVILGVTGLQELALPLGARLGHPIWRRALAEAGITGERADEIVNRISAEYVAWQENSFPGLLGNVVAGRIANRLNLRGTNCVVDAACASSLSAAHLGVMELATGRSDMVLAGGVDALNDIFMFMCFSKTPALSPTGDARPFSDEADGTVLGEGVGMVVLKRLEDAQCDGDRIYAVLKSIGTSSDGRSQSIYAPHAGGQARALRNAYSMAGFEPDSVELIEAHGTGTKVGDVVEFEALETVFGEFGAEKNTCALGSVKSQIGHTKAAAGVAGLIKAALAIYHRALPPTIKVNKPNAKFVAEDSPLYLNTELRPWISRHTRRAGVSAFGFGGSNFHAVLEENSSSLPEPAWDGSAQIVALSSKSTDEIAFQLDQLRSTLTEEHADDRHLAYCAAQSRKAFDPNMPHRLVFIINDGDDASELLDAAKAKLTSAAGTQRGSENIFYGQGEPNGKIAFLFPGQGSQYPRMAADLACTFPEMIESLSQADAAGNDTEQRLSSLMYPVPAFDESEKSQQARTLTATQFAQPAIGAISLGMSCILERFGIRPDLLAGHSYGELTALAVSGRFDSSVLHRLSRLRGRLMAEGDGGRGAMLAVKSSAPPIEKLIADHKLLVTIANKNSPMQTVLSGEREEIVKAAEALRAAGIAAQPLNVSGAFHSTLMESAAASFRQALESIEFLPGTIPIIANTTARAYPAGNPGRSILAAQLTSTIDFVGVVNNLYDAGARVIVEVGPKNVLSGLVKSTLADRPHTTLALDTSAGRGSGLLDLARVLAFLSADGRRVDLGKWERDVPEPRKLRMVVKLVGANLRPKQPPVTSTKQVRSLPAEALVTSNESVPQFIPAEKQVPINYPLPRENEMKPQEKKELAPQATSDAMRVIQDGLLAMQALQQQTATAHQKFLEAQEQAHRTFQQLIESQQRLLLGGAPSQLSAVPPAPVTSAIEKQATAPVPISVPVTHPVSKAEQSNIQIEDPPGQNPKSKIAPIAAPVPKSNNNAAGLVLEVVAEKTGYPQEMIDLDMDIEADLGIDSIKRVEIIAAVEERIPEFKGIKPEYMGSLRTLRQIVEFVNSECGADTTNEPTPALPIANTEQSRTDASAVDFAAILLDVVAQLTGYPRETLDVTMDMEADLGIDSIKRVEILAAVEARVPGLPPVKPDYMGSLRTLAQIVEYFASENPPPAPQQDVPQKGPEPQETKPAAASHSPQRRILSIVDLPPTSAGKLPIPAGSEVWITEIGTGLSQSIADGLRAAGHATRIVTLNQLPIAPEKLGGLIILAPGATEDDNEFIKQSFKLIRSCRLALHASAGDGGAILASVSRMDGAFGLRGTDFDAAQGGLSGLIKTAAREWPAVACRTLDVSPEMEVARAAKSILAELSSNGPIEVGLSDNRRVTLELHDAKTQSGPPHLHPGDVVVITGGARGVTAEAAVALAHAIQPTLVLLGRSHAPSAEPAWLSGLTAESEIKSAILKNEFAGQSVTPQQLRQSFDHHMSQREIRRTLRRVAEAGARVRYECLDVRDAAAVAKLVQTIRKENGPIRGLIHGAGTLEDRRIEDKTDAQFVNVYDTKVKGLDHVLAALRLDELRQLVLFSSVSARFGNPGQIDYAAANEVLNKTAQRLARKLPSCHVRSINWGPWDGGMVNSSLKRVFIDQGVGLIPLQDGAAALIAECLDTSDAVEVIIGSNLPSSSDRTRNVPQVGAEDFKPAFERTLDVESHPFLTSHMLDARPVLPAAMLMEWMGQAAVHANPGLSLVGMDNVRILKGVVIDSDSKTLRFETSKFVRDNSQFKVSVQASSTSPRSYIHSTGSAVLSTSYPAPPAATEVGKLQSEKYPLSVDAAYEQVLFHGPNFHVVEQIVGYSDAGIVARIRSAPRPREWMAHPIRPEWLSDPLAVDSAFQLAILWCHVQAAGVCLPSHVAQYRQFRARFPADGVIVALKVLAHQRSRLSFDVAFTDTSGGGVAQMLGCECTIDPALRNAFKRRSLISIAT